MFARITTLFIFIGLCCGIATGQIPIAQRLAVVQFQSSNGKTGTASIHRSGYPVEDITRPAKRRESSFLELGDVLTRIEEMQREGWKVLDMDASVSISHQEGKMMYDQVILHTWYMGSEE